MPTNGQSQSLAVLIDADNASVKYAQAIFEEIAKFGEANVRRIYGDFSGSRLSGWNEAVQSLAILQHQQRNNTTGKNAADIALVIDAMDLMHKGKLDGFCLISSDSDFTRLAQRLREENLEVYGFGERKTPAAFISACTKFIYVDNLINSDEHSGDDQKSRNDASSETSVAAPVTDGGQRDRAVPAKPAQPKVSSAAEASSPKPYTAAVPFILKAIKQIEDDDGWYSLAEVGSVLSKLHPDFDSRTYGCPKLSELAKKTGQLQTKKTAEGIILVARKPLNSIK